MATTFDARLNRDVTDTVTDDDYFPLVNDPADTAQNQYVSAANLSAYVGGGGGSGDVTKVGTPVNNQIGVWTGDGTLEGDAGLTFDGDQFLVPSTNDAVTPNIAFGDGDTGFYERGDDTLAISVNGVHRFDISSNDIRSATSFGALVNRLASSATVPAFGFANDGNTGLGRHSEGNASLIANGVEAVRAEDPATLAAGETSLWLYDADNATIEQVTVGAADSGGAGFKVLRIPN